MFLVASNRLNRLESSGSSTTYQSVTKAMLGLKFVKYK